MNGYLYPLKYIYALVINKEPGLFNTSEAISALRKIGIELSHIPIDNKTSFYAQVSESLNNKASRKERLKSADKIPRQKLSKILVYERNPDVVAEVLEKAKGICEECETPAPFIRKKDSTPYLEVHHKIQLTNGGQDTVENAEALCPNCHKKKHYG